MKTKIFATMKFIGLATCIMLGLVSIIGTGGGGGGGGVAVTPSPYTGITTQAQITGDNAELLAVGTWVTGDLGTNVDIFGAVKADQQVQDNFFSLGFVPFFLEDTIQQLEIPSSLSQSYYGVVQNVTFDPLYGTCGGVVTGNGTGDDATGMFTFSLDFNNYCDDDVTIDGAATLSGTIDLGTEELVVFTMSFSSLSINDTIILDGTFSANYTVSPVLVSMSYVALFNQTMKTYWFRDVQYQLLGGDTYVDIVAITGRYYDHDIGYVNISVDESIRINDTENWPSSGSYILTGAAGTKARLTFLNVTDFQVEADTDGDNLYDDYSSGAKSWASF